MTPQLKITHYPGIGWAYHFNIGREVIVDIGFLTRWGARQAGEKALKEHLQAKEKRQ